ncbi:gas vesicle protein GvpP [Sutcliffiella horikoshii]|uniref:Gas vesicle protein GvpP n=1 Tax=Sutcliffiella horikoshii TaxID=79883 RepID=A0A1Y0CUS3_9BACI|nr:MULTISPECIES: GvpT/GvpP family gas vesicle accessory protein [Bacillaceae]ART78676.1 gas vesicle protein GvpP [Sutcliffiella horikoshii]TYS71468.1 gas vesicle protein GvpP [Sutcliffiella horikoshii]
MAVKEKNEQQEEQNEQQEEKNDNSNYSINLAIVGGVVGAGIGLLSSPGTSKKLFKNISQSEVVKVAGNQLRRSAQEMLAAQAQNGIKQLASGYMGKNVVSLMSPLKSDEKKKSKADDASSELDEIKEENKSINNRLDKIENMLGELVDSKK